MAKASNGNNKTARKKNPTSIDTAAKRPQPVAAAAFKADGDIEDRIRQRAYELYEQEGRQEGRDQEYWFRAEAEVRGRRSA
jgi:Protein of unknown function (DUF2934)